MWLLLALLACGPKEEAPMAPDLVVVGQVHATPPDAPSARAVVIDGGLVREVVEPDAGRALAGPGTTVIEATHVTPGFVDAHAHPLGLGRLLGELDLTGASTYAETLARVAAAKGEGWLFGRGWDQNDWTDRDGWPSAADLDRVAPGRPVLLRRVDGHAAWVSSEALRLSGIDRGTPDPPGGRILRGPDGAPTGVLVDNAMDLLEVPATDGEEIERQLERAFAEMASHGLTGAHEMGIGDAALAVYERLDAAGRLPVRIWAYVSPGSEAAARLATSGPWRGEHLAVVGVKAYADGALGSRGALLSEEYADEPGTRGLPIQSAEDLRAIAVRTLGGGAQVAIHAIGDLAVTHALDAFAAARAAHPKSEVRLRIEHAQIVRPEDLPRFAELGVVASVQPTHATSDMPWAADRLGPERIGWAYTWRSLADAGAALAFGSDFPVEEVDPGLGLWSATRRTDLKGHPEGGWMPEEQVTLGEAIAGFTAGAAYAVHEEDRLGKLAPGRPADLTLWRVEDGRWQPVATIVAGEIVWKQ